MGVRAVVFGFHNQVFLIHPKVILLIILDLPGLLFFSTYTLLILFWAEIYHQARSLPTEKLRIVYIQSIVSYTVVSIIAVLGLLLYGGRKVSAS